MSKRRTQKPGRTPGPRHDASSEALDGLRGRPVPADEGALRSFAHVCVYANIRGRPVPADEGALAWLDFTTPEGDDDLQVLLGLRGIL